MFLCRNLNSFTRGGDFTLGLDLRRNCIAFHDGYLEEMKSTALCRSVLGLGVSDGLRGVEKFDDDILL